MRVQKKLIVIAGALSGLLLIGCGEQEINLEDYLTVTYSGANGYATAEVEFDYTAFGDAIVENGNDKEMSLMEVLAAADNVKISSAVKDNLSNDDTFGVKFEWDSDAAKELGLKYIGKEQTFTVEGLKDPEEIDPFSDLEVIFTGVSPNGKAEILDARTDYFIDYRYDIEPKAGLKNGDTVIMSIVDANPDETAIQEGYVLSQTEKQFVVEGLSYYVSSIQEIPDDMMEKMKKQTEDVIDSSATAWADGNEILNKEFVGNYLLVKKEGIRYGDENYCYCVYKVDATIDGEENFTFYYYVRFRNVMILEDGLCSVDLTNYDKPSGQGFFGSVSGEAFIVGKYWFVGYEELDSMFNNCVTKYVADYTYETTVNE